MARQKAIREAPVNTSIDEAPLQTSVEEPSPGAKAAHCVRCDARFVPKDGQTFCDDCLVSEAKRRTKRAGYTRCRVIGNVAAVGMVEDGHFRTTFVDGEVAEFSDEDVLSLPGSFAPIDE